MAFNPIQAIQAILELENKIEELVSLAQEYIANVKKKKRREAMQAAWDLRKTDPQASAKALRDLMFEDDGDDDPSGPDD